MDLHKATRDPSVWGQLALFALIGLGVPLLPRYLSLGNLDSMLNRVDPDRIRWLGAPLIAAGLALAAWGVRSLGRSLTPGTEPLPGAPLAGLLARAYLNGKAKREERWLVRRYPTYEAYMRQVPRRVL
jgi:protein-S-isoprenylcysteine O-methyltransferase Ste14